MTEESRQPEQPVLIPKGDPTWSVWIWRQDSMLLARMRPIIEEFLRLDGIGACIEQIEGSTYTCRENRFDDPDTWCFYCRFHHLSNQLRGLR